MKQKIKTKFGSATMDQKGYYRISSSKENNYNKMLHRLIWEDWYGKPIPKGYFIHHLNHQKDDNRIQNLQCVESKSHRKYHSSNPSKETRRKLSETKKGELNPNFNKPLSEEQKEILLKYAKEPKSEKHKENLSISRNTVGYVNVSKHYSTNYKKGYTWRYSYSENGKRYDIHRTKLGDLEKEVKRRNLNWKRIDNGGDLNIV